MKTSSTPILIKSASRILLHIIATLPDGWEVRIGPEIDPNDGCRFFAACVFDSEKKLLFGVSAMGPRTLCRLLSNALKERLIDLNDRL
jgi:hypothetical protein